MEKIKVMIAEDHKMFRDMLSNYLVETDNIDVIGLAKDGQALIDLIKQSMPNIVILDLRMPILDGKATLKILSRDFPNIKTIILSSEYSHYLVAYNMINGASAYLKKDSDILELETAIHTVFKDGYYFNENITKEILDLLNSSKKIYYLIKNKKFSEREIEVMQELCKDISTEKTAENLHMTEYTLKWHKGNIIEKLEGESIVSLVKYALRQGIIDDD